MLLRRLKALVLIMENQERSARLPIVANFKSYSAVVRLYKAFSYSSIFDSISALF